MSSYLIWKVDMLLEFPVFDLYYFARRLSLKIPTKDYLFRRY